VVAVVLVVALLLLLLTSCADWPASDVYWHDYLTAQQRVKYTEVPGKTLCSLVSGADKAKTVKGVVLYAQHGYAGAEAEEWTAPIAVTQAIQLSALPVTAAMLKRHACLASMKVLKDMTKMPDMAIEETAWAWAFKALLPKASKTVAYNLYHYTPWIKNDPQSNATLANIGELASLLVSLLTPSLTSLLDLKTTPCSRKLSSATSAQATPSRLWSTRCTQKPWRSWTRSTAPSAGPTTRCVSVIPAACTPHVPAPHPSYSSRTSG